MNKVLTTQLTVTKDVTKEKPEERSSEESGENQHDPDKNTEVGKPWYHESSSTESDALRAMIGKRGEESDGDDSDERGNLSEK